MSIPFETTLTERFGYQYDTESEHSPLLLVANYHTNPNLHPKQLIFLEFAEILSADAVLFRYFEEGDNRFCIPQIYIYDNTNERYKEQKIVEIHRNVYSSCQVPMMIVVGRAEVKIYDVRKKIKIEENGNLSNDDCLIKTIENLEIANEAITQYHGRLFANGTFWESDAASAHFLDGTTAYETLIKALNDIRKDFFKNRFFKKIPKTIENETEKEKKAREEEEKKEKEKKESTFTLVLTKLFLAKYLEENAKDGNDKNLAASFFEKNNLPTTIHDCFTQNRYVDLFTALESHFNGGVFVLNEDENTILENESIRNLLVLFLEGKLSTNRQLFIWQEYSFRYMPIELISNFYEVFIPDEKDAVYTPSYLVNLLVDECLPLSTKHTNDNVKLIDPSCGSGIFLAAAFKRLVQRRRVRTFKNNQLGDITPKIANTILKKNIFGIDKNETATHLTKFSLYIALCQTLTPAQIWAETDDKLFKNIGKNIIHQDFFDFLIENENVGSFDLVIGNPPFESKKDLNSIIKKLNKTNYKLAEKIPDKQIALLFLDKAPALLKENGLLCFIQKATSLLYTKKSKNFRNYILQNYHIEQIIDFTLLKETLFKAKVESLAIFIRKTERKSDFITHIVAKSLQNNLKKLFFEFDYYDFHEVSVEYAIENEHIWRCNLLGGGRLTVLISDIYKKGTPLKELVENDANIGANRYSEGFIRGNCKNDAPYILNRKWLTAKKFHGVNNFNLTQPTLNQKFEGKRTEALFTAPLLVIKEEIKNNQIPIAFFETENIAFDSQIVGISATADGLATIKHIYKCMQDNNQLYAFFTLATTSRFYWGTSASAQMQDISKFPIPKAGTEINLSYLETILKDDVLNYTYPSWYDKRTPLNQIINIENNEIPTELTQFAEIYTKMINVIYAEPEDNMALRLTEVISGNGFFALQFEFTKADTIAIFIENSAKLDALLEGALGRNAVIKRVIQYHNGENKICLIKPKQLRYWLRSIAVRDADDTFADLIEAGY